MAGSEEALTSLERAVSSMRRRLKRTRLPGLKPEEISAIRNLVLAWPTDIRPSLALAGSSEVTLESLDAVMDELAEVGERPRYREVVGRASSLVAALRTDAALERFRQQRAQASPPTDIAGRLRLVSPSAADSYEQALADLRDPSRVSFRGTANELRSVLWDVLNQLAPDDEVMAQEGFELRDGLTTPSQLQRARYALKKVKASTNVQQAGSSAVELIELRVAELARAAYTRSSASVHVAAGREEVTRILSYLDSLLGDLLPTPELQPTRSQA